MEIIIETSPPEKLRTGVVVVGAFAGGALSPAARALDEASSGRLSTVIRRGDLDDWRAGSSLLVHDVPGIAAYTLRETIDKRPEFVQAFVSGLVRAQDLINDSTAEQITELVHGDYMSALSKDSVLKAVALYKETVWLEDNLITEDAYDRMAQIMGDGRQFSNEQMKTVPYSRCADMSFVRKARGKG